MSLQQTNVFSASLLQTSERTLAESDEVVPPDRDSMRIAAALHARCPVSGGGSAIVVSPESSLPVFRTMARLGRALEKVTGESVLTIGFGFSTADTTSKGMAAAESRPADRGLAADRVLVSPAGADRAILASMSVSWGDLLGASGPGELSRFLLELKTKFRFVLIEGKSLKTSPETVLLGQAADGVVLTVEQGVSSLTAVKEAQHAARLAGLLLLGFVMENGQRQSAGRRA